MPLATFVRSRWLFLRLLGVVYLMAFVSLAVQITGLVGEHGLIPAASDRSLLLRAWGGAAVSVLLVAGVVPAASAVVAWALYWSLTIAGEEFLRFQWDGLLLETGLLAVLYAPFAWRSRLSTDLEPPAAVRWVLWFLAFKLTFLSGVTKIVSGDRTWAAWTALTYHYETQPIPAWTSWYMHQLPASVHFWSAAGMFVVEVAVSWLIFAPPRFVRVRAVAAVIMIALQLGIAATGNYGFFNLLTIVLYLALLDDRMLTWRPPPAGSPPGPLNGAAIWHLLASGLALLVACFSVMTLFREIDLTRGQPSVLRRAWSSAALGAVAPLDSINGYGLFRVMTTERPEIVIEVSGDGTSWKEYEFMWKAGDVTRRPSFVEPHMPRLDWQMWFAALDPQGAQRWLAALMQRVLDGDAAVARLLGPNPLGGRPQCVKLVYYQYHFTSRAERAATGAWWKRERIGDLTNRACR
ncbi:MAG TPA: lipase maturation factor family protein [Vicinamibacterales bacterium]|nr:lipase maturation factor family protein [Vicinamibacterales bacterium]